MNDFDLMIVQWMLWASFVFMIGIVALIVYCGLHSGPNPRTRLPYYIVDDLRKRGKLPKGYR